jgi:hypothetical protein
MKFLKQYRPALISILFLVFFVFSINYYSDYSDRYKLKDEKNKLLEFIQKTNDSEIFTHIFSNHYNGPSFISYGRYSYQGEIIVNNPSSPYYNVEQVGNRFYYFVFSLK